MTKFKHPYFGTSSTILKQATQLVAKSVRPGESISAIQRKVDEMVKYLEEKNGIIDVPESTLPSEITPEEVKLFWKKGRKKSRPVLPIRKRNTR